MNGTTDTDNVRNIPLNNLNIIYEEDEDAYYGTIYGTANLDVGSVNNADCACWPIEIDKKRNDICPFLQSTRCFIINISLLILTIALLSFMISFFIPDIVHTSALKGEINLIKEKHSECTSSNSELNNKYEESVSDVKALQKQLTDSRMQVTSLNNTLTQKSQQLDTATFQNNLLEDRMVTLKKTLANVETEKSLLEDRMVTLKKTLANVETEVTSLNNTLTQKSQQLDAAKFQNNLLEDRMVTLKKTLADVETELRLANLHAALIEREQELKRFQSENKALVSEGSRFLGNLLTLHFSVMFCMFHIINKLL